MSEIPTDKHIHMILCGCRDVLSIKATLLGDNTLSQVNGVKKANHNFAYKRMR